MHEHPAVYRHACIHLEHTEDLAAKSISLVCCTLIPANISIPFFSSCSERSIQGLPSKNSSATIICAAHHLCCRIYQLSPPREHRVSSIFVGDMHLLLILQVSNKKFAHIFEGINIPTQFRRSVSRDSHLEVRPQPATGSASTSLASPARRMDSASALRASSRCCRIAHCFQLVSHTSISSTVLSGLRKASRSRLGSKQNLPNSIELYRLATAGPVVSAPRTSPRRLGVRFFLMQ